MIRVIVFNGTLIRGEFISPAEADQMAYKNGHYYAEKFAEQYPNGTMLILSDRESDRYQIERVIETGKGAHPVSHVPKRNASKK